MARKMHFGRLACRRSVGQYAAPQPQPTGDTQWRSTLNDLLSRPPGTMNLQDLQRFEDSVRMATSYFGTLTPGDYEANRELVRRMMTYMAAMNVMSKDPRMRYALRRANQALMVLRSTLPPGLSTQLGPAPAYQGAEASPLRPQPKTGEAPYQMHAPDLANVPDADRAKARELENRYESAAAQAAVAWQSAEILRQNLAVGGMALNTQTATSIARLQLYLENAVDALRELDWEDARINIERAEYETDKVLKTVGR